MTPTDGFAEFAAAASGRLRRTAFLLCGDWHTAEDLAQVTLAKLFVSWRRISQRDEAYAYATRTLVNTYLADRRLRRAGELLTAQLPERPCEQQAPELRIMVLGALAALPRKARAAVVLRYWADMSVGQVAELLGCSEGTVKSQCARGLDLLRPALGDAAADLGFNHDPVTGQRETGNG